MNRITEPARTTPRSPSSRRRSLAWSLALVAAAASSAASGPLSFATFLSARAGGTTDSGAVGPVSAAEPSPYGTYSASADYGCLVVDPSFEISDSDYVNGLSTIASFQDDLVITAPGVPAFTQGTLTVSGFLEGGPTYSPTASSSDVIQAFQGGYTLFVNRNGSTYHNVNGSILFNSGASPQITGTVPAPGLVHFDLPFFFGQTTTIELQLFGNASGRNTYFAPDTGMLTGSSRVTFRMSGISSIRDTLGTQYLSTATVMSGSGTDWAGTPALELVRLGAPANPDALRPGVTSGPVIGGVWDPVIDHTSFHPTANADFLLFSTGPPVNSASPFGTLLCTVPPANQIFIRAPIGTPFAIPIPNDCGLVGLSACTQGASFRRGDLRLTNALDITVGAR